MASSSPIHLSILVGVGAPLPAPREVVDALLDARITSASGEASGFQLSFRLSDASALRHLFMVGGGAVHPMLRVVLTAVVGGAPEVLIDGIVAHLEVNTGEDGQSTLSVIGEDLSRAMDFVDFRGVAYPAMPPEARVALVLGKYAALGIVPMAVPTVLPQVDVPTDRFAAHQGTDLSYVRRLAAEAGYVFHIEPGPLPGASVAYWGPEIKTGAPQPALTVEIDLHRNVESISFSLAAHGRRQPILFVHDPRSKVAVPVPVPESSLVNPPLAALPTLPTEFEVLGGAAKRSPAAAALLGLSEAGRSAEAATASGSLSVPRYGRVLRSRRLVGVRGAGHAWDGLWYVRSVTHRLRRGEFKQDFSLSRNGVGSTVPVVLT